MKPTTKASCILAFGFAGGFWLSANALTLDEIAPHFSTNTEIVWKAQTNGLPKRLTVYKCLPQTFSAATLSNALALTPIRTTKTLVPSTNRICIWDHTREGDDPMAGYFAVSPEFANVSYRAKYHYMGPPSDIPNGEVIAKRAWEIATELGLDRTQLAQKEITTNLCEYDLKGRITTNNPCGHNISLARRIGEVDFYSSDEGFSIEFGSNGQIRSFSLSWPNLKQFETQPTASPEQIIACIRAHQTPMAMPSNDDGSYLVKVKELAKAKRLTITKVTPFYGEGKYGQEPKEQGLAEFVSPFAELDIIADFGNTNFSTRLLSPILVTDAVKLSRPRN